MVRVFAVSINYFASTYLRPRMLCLQLPPVHCIAVPPSRESMTLLTLRGVVSMILRIPCGNTTQLQCSTTYLMPRIPTSEAISCQLQLESLVLPAERHHPRHHSTYSLSADRLIMVTVFPVFDDDGVPCKRRQTSPMASLRGLFFSPPIRLQHV
jgi:hypothetical protein